MCGEKKFTFDAGKLIPGSPPRMRGKEIGKINNVRFVGITPAYAGKSCMLCWLLVRSWDHPRMCGEKF